MKIVDEKEAMETASHGDNGTAKDGSTNDFDPWHPPCDPRPSKPDDLDFDSYVQLVTEWSKQTNNIIAASRATHIIIPDRTPQALNDAFYNICHLVLPILKQDNVSRFLRFFKEDGRGLYWGLIITPETFNHMIVENALKCAKVALEGQAPELSGYRANPNCMNQYGYFPLHEAAERFSVDMVKLLLEHGALTNLRTAGSQVVEGLLPLHKIFLDTTRLLAENTDNLLDEIWNYVKDGKVVQTAVLLMAAQKHVRGGYYCKTNGETKVDGFTVIIKRIHQSMMFQNEEKLQQGHSNIKAMLSVLLLVNIISAAGEAIDAGISVRSKMTPVEVLERVSSILKDHGFCPTGESINIENLCPYKIPMPNRKELKEKGSSVATKVTTEDSDLSAAGKKRKRVDMRVRFVVPLTLKSEIGRMRQVVRKRVPRGWKHKYTWLSFFPYWRSILASEFPVKVFPGHARDDTKHVRDLWRTNTSMSNSTDTVSIDHNLGLLQRISQPPGLYQPRRGFGTALTVLKLLKKA
ncbi:hypothetical protein PR202_gb18446 [Eleusine coracana subsp. coracana]|uniref:Uncharacterized protein n=1 Tax=Eleusine coracana subsp. coracana TaxID=191504 RepID=A0AAV5F705_ELECO|nr:hypothetical protein PR202_gb18446 [Eleusine coracana subsp. coracana]